jgi:hypothetical protein
MLYRISIFFFWSTMLFTSAEQNYDQQKITENIQQKEDTGEPYFELFYDKKNNQYFSLQSFEAQKQAFFERSSISEPKKKLAEQKAYEIANHYWNCIQHAPLSLPISIVQENALQKAKQSLKGDEMASLFFESIRLYREPVDVLKIDDEEFKKLQMCTITKKRIEHWNQHIIRSAFLKIGSPPYIGRKYSKDHH